MMIGKAIDDAAVKGPVTAFLEEQVRTRSGDYPPNESIESIGARVADPNFVCMIDDTEHDGVSINAIAGFFIVEPDLTSLVPLERDWHVVVIWWLPRAPKEANNAPLLVPVFGAACDEVLRLYPASGPWSIYGYYPGVGADFAARTASSREMVDFWITYFNSTPAGIIAGRARNPYNKSQYAPVSTVKQMSDFAKWVATQ